MLVSVMNKTELEGSGYVHGISGVPMISPTVMCGGDRRLTVEEKVVERGINGGKKGDATYSSSSTSSIGKNSDISGKSAGDSGDGEEVQSPFKGPLDTMEALEDVLPMRRGISRFYNGKSKSYASLADASLSSIKDVAKPENVYMKRRRNLLASDKSRNFSLKSGGGGVSKRVTANSRGRPGSLGNITPAYTNDIAFATAASPAIMGGSHLNPQLKESPSPRLSMFLGWRSFSLDDLQHAGSVMASCAASAQLVANPSQT